MRKNQFISIFYNFFSLKGLTTPTSLAKVTDYYYLNPTSDLFHHWPTIWLSGIRQAKGEAEAAFGQF